MAGRLWQTRGGRAGLSALGMVLLFILLIVTVETAGMIRSAANRAPENTTAVVLGCSVKGERPSRVLSERLCAAYEYLTGIQKLCAYYLADREMERRSARQSACTVT
ncbi:MAG: hypothetical protein ACLS3D_16435 [Roseburia hominis]